MCGPSVPEPRGSGACGQGLETPGEGAASRSDRWSCGGLPEVCVFTGSQILGVSEGAGLLGAPNPDEDAAQTPVLGCSLGGLLKLLLSNGPAWVSFCCLCTLILRRCEVWGGLCAKTYSGSYRFKSLSKL